MSSFRDGHDNIRNKRLRSWHLDDMVIDIDPDPANGRTVSTNPAGGYLTLTYTIGTVLQGDVDGNDDSYLLDVYDAYFEYEIQTIV